MSEEPKANASGVSAVVPRNPFRPSLRQQEILKFLAYFREIHGYSPTIRDIQFGCSISSTSVVDYNLRILAREGVITRDPEVSRSIELRNAEGPATPNEPIKVPLVGFIAAGIPLPIPTDLIEAEEMVELPSGDLRKQTNDLYALRVHGTSMIDALIDDGDIVVLRRPTDIHDGDMVAAWLIMEQEATLKRIFHEGDKVKLQPANSQFATIVTNASNVEVHGKVIAVLRKLESK